MKIYFLLMSLVCLSYQSTGCKQEYFYPKQPINANFLKDLENKIQQWFFDELKPGTFEDLTRKDKINNSLRQSPGSDRVKEELIKQAIEYAKNHSFDSEEDCRIKVKRFVQQKAHDIAKDIVLNDLYVQLKNYSFNGLNQRERSVIAQQVAEKINQITTKGASAHELLSIFSSSQLNSELIHNMQHKSLSYHPFFVPTAPYHSDQEQQDRAKGKEIVRDLKGCMLSPNCWAEVSVFMHKY